MASRLPVGTGHGGRRLFDPFAMLHQQMDRVFEDFFRTPAMEGAVESATLRPRIDVTEDEKHVEIVAELPGVEEKDLDVQVHGDVLSIRAEKKVEREEKDKAKTWHLSERSYGCFVRSLELPFEPEADKVEATFNKGVLHVRLPKPANAQRGAKRIAVKPGNSNPPAGRA